MKINVKKLDATISKLQELRRLATDPALAPFVEITGVRQSANGASASSDQGASGGGNGYGQLKTAVLEACKELHSFTVREVFASLQQKAYPFSGVNAEKSIANILRVLAKDGQITVDVQGAGRRPTSYRA